MPDDERMNRLENKLDEQGKSIAEIREKVFNGFGTTIEEIHREVQELRRLAEKVDNINATLVDHRLDTCPLREHLSKRFERRTAILMAATTVTISAITLWANLVL